MPTPDAVFEEHRAALSRHAYRMLGSLADADDVVQDAYLRWRRADRAGVRSPRAFLLQVVTRLAIDRRAAIDARKETYVGPWLPEPIVESADAPPGAGAEAAEEVSMAFLVLLENLGPVERAAYLLRRVFDHEYDEIARILERSEAACRQIVSRAEARVLARRPRFEADTTEASRLTAAFLEACTTGDVAALTRILAPDAVLVSDGGGKAAAATQPVEGADRVARFFVGVFRRAAASPQVRVRRVLVNGRPGIAAEEDGRLVTVLTLDVADGLVRACYVVRNPDKLARAAASVGPA